MYILRMQISFYKHIPCYSRNLFKFQRRAPFQQVFQAQQQHCAYVYRSCNYIYKGPAIGVCTCLCICRHSRTNMALYGRPLDCITVAHALPNFSKKSLIICKSLKIGIILLYWAGMASICYTACFQQTTNIIYIYSIIIEEVQARYSFIGYPYMYTVHDDVMFGL